MQLSKEFSTEQLAETVQRLAAAISSDYSSAGLHLVIVLNGAFIFAADLARQLTVPVTVDFVRLASYIGTETTGTVTISKDLESSIEGRDVLVVEDIVDTGVTLEFLLERLREKNPGSLRVCTMFDKPARRLRPISPDYVGIVVDDRFLVGYGLDLDGRMRELPSVYAVHTPEWRP